MKIVGSPTVRTGIEKTAKVLHTTPEEVGRQLIQDPGSLVGKLAGSSFRTLGSLSAALTAARTEAKQSGKTYAEFITAVCADLSANIVEAGPIPKDRRSVNGWPVAGLAPRPKEFGSGITQRAVGMTYNDALVGVNLGPIQEAPTEGVVCPTMKRLALGAGAVENVLAESFGIEAYEAAANKAWQNRKGRNGAAAAIQSEGALPGRGIKALILSIAAPRGEQKSEQGMSDLTYEACKAAHEAGISSLTVPAIGTGFAAEAGFGLKLDQSMRGFADGVKRFLDEHPDSQLKTIDYNVYLQKPTEEDAAKVAAYLNEHGVPKILQD